MDRYIRRLGRFEAISFMTGFALMTFELVAARLLAPTIGSSLYVWTSVIGIIIIALSIGYAVGGRIADARTRQLDVAWLLLLTALSVVVVAVTERSFLSGLAQVGGDPRLQGVVASMVLFAPTSFLLGVVSPYLARLRITAMKTSGESVALLSSLNSLGGIAGTFLTGFILFSFVSLKQALALVAMVLVGASWLVMSRSSVPRRILLSVVIVGVSLLSAFTPLAPGLVGEVTTPSATYQIMEAKLKKDTVNLLVTGPFGFQSGAYTDGRNDLAFPYAQKMADIVEQAPQKQRILMLGGGALTLPRYLAERYPSARIDVVEIDPELRSIAERYFNYNNPPAVTFIAQDARTFVNAAKTHYDVILVDVYSDSSIPFSFATHEYGEQIARLAGKKGLVVANFVAGQSNTCQPLLRQLHATYANELSYSLLFPMVEPTLEQRQNIIAVYGDTPLRVSENGAYRAHIAQSASYSDDFAPLERLTARCHFRRG